MAVGYIPQFTVLRILMVSSSFKIFLLSFFFQVCEKCQNVKYEREGYFVTVDIEKGMQDGQVSFIPFKCDMQVISR